MLLACVSQIHSFINKSQFSIFVLLSLNIFRNILAVTKSATREKVGVDNVWISIHKKDGWMMTGNHTRMVG